MKIAVFGSGRGSNFEALLSAKIPNAEFVLVLSNKKDAKILELAKKNGIEAGHFESLVFSKEKSNEVLDLLLKKNIELIVLAGFLRKISPEIIKKFPRKIINIHPALLPDFGGKGMFGLHVHEAVVKAGEKFSGATVHFVTDDYDAGEVILQERVSVDFGETTESLAGKVLKVEHKIFAQALSLVINGRLKND